MDAKENRLNTYGIKGKQGSLENTNEMGGDWVGKVSNLSPGTVKTNWQMDFEFKLLNKNDLLEIYLNSFATSATEVSSIIGILDRHEPPIAPSLPWMHLHSQAQTPQKDDLLLFSHDLFDAPTMKIICVPTPTIFPMGINTWLLNKKKCNYIIVMWTIGINLLQFNSKHYL